MHCKSYSHFFSKKFQHICVSLGVNFNESLTNDVVSFEQLVRLLDLAELTQNFVYLIFNVSLRIPILDLAELEQLLTTQNFVYLIFNVSLQKHVPSRARENRKNSRSRNILDRFQTPQNANKSVQQVCALNPILFSRINFISKN